MQVNWFIRTLSEWLVYLEGCRELFSRKRQPLIERVQTGHQILYIDKAVLTDKLFHLIKRLELLEFEHKHCFSNPMLLSYVATD